MLNTNKKVRVCTSTHAWDRYILMCTQSNKLRIKNCFVNYRIYQACCVLHINYICSHVSLLLAWREYFHPIFMIIVSPTSFVGKYLHFTSSPTWLDLHFFCDYVLLRYVFTRIFSVLDATTYFWKKNRASSEISKHTLCEKVPISFAEISFAGVTPYWYGRSIAWGTSYWILAWRSPWWCGPRDYIRNSLSIICSREILCWYTVSTSNSRNTTYEQHIL